MKSDQNIKTDIDGMSKEVIFIHSAQYPIENEPGSAYLHSQLFS